MFLTYPHFEQAMPSGLAPQGSRFWRAVEVSLRMPWLVLTLLEQSGGGEFERTVLLSNSSDLVSVVGTHQAQSFRGLHLVAHASLSGDGSGWVSRAVFRVWTDNSASKGQHGMLIYEDEIGRMLDEFGTEPPNSSGSRSLLLELPIARAAPRASVRRSPRRTSTKP
jgi:hypothetical protein